MKKYHLTRTAVFVMLERGDELFLLRRANTGWNDGKWTLPSGHVEEGETVREAAVKEVAEEAGVAVAKDDLEFVHVHYVYDAYTNFYFRTTKWDGEPILGEPHLCSEIGWFRKDALPEDTIFHVMEMLREVATGHYFSDVANDPGH